MQRRVNRRPVISERAARSITSTATIPAPTLGLNAIDNLVTMPAAAAIRLTNFVAKPYGCECRKGSKKFVENLPSTVDSLMVYNAGSELGSRLFAASFDSIYDATETTSAPVAVRSGFGNAKWESVNFSTPGGRYMLAVNGNDPAQLFDGTTWTGFTTVASPSAPGQVSGIDTQLWSNITHYKLRVWAVERNSLKAWYLPINSVGGTATSFDFGAYTRKGGHLVALTSWSIDSGKGLDDVFVAVTSEGEILIYEGIDPSSSDTWQLRGIWEVAPPASKRCFMKYGPEVLYLSRDGVSVLSRYLDSDGIDVSAGLSVPIRQLINEAVEKNRLYHGFELIQHTPENVVIVNVPGSTASTQYVFNTITRAWSKFSGWNAQCFAVFKGDLYFGGRNAVLQAFTGYRDEADANGLNGKMYQAEAQQSFNYFDEPGVKKHFRMVRLTATTDVTPKMQVGVNADFDFGIKPTPMTSAAVAASTWNNGLWNAAIWGRESSTIKQWHTTYAVGYAASLTVIINVTGKITWTSSDWIIEAGAAV